MFEKLRTAIETAPEKVSSTTTQLVNNVRHRAHTWPAAKDTAASGRPRPEP